MSIQELVIKQGGLSGEKRSEESWRGQRPDLSQPDPNGQLWSVSSRMEPILLGNEQLAFYSLL